LFLYTLPTLISERKPHASLAPFSSLAYISIYQHMPPTNNDSNLALSSIFACATTVNSITRKHRAASKSAPICTRPERRWPASLNRFQRKKPKPTGALKQTLHALPPRATPLARHPYPSASSATRRRRVQRRLYILAPSTPRLRKQLIAHTHKSNVQLDNRAIVLVPEVCVCPKLVAVVAS
jgi:hypothetical protein